MKMKKINTLIVSFIIITLALSARVKPAYSQGLQNQAKELEHSILKQRKARKTASIAHRYLYKLCQENYDIGRYDEAKGYAKKILAMDPGAEEAKNWLLRIETAEASLAGIILPETQFQAAGKDVVIEKQVVGLPEEESWEAAPKKEEEILEEPQLLKEAVAAKEPQKEKAVIIKEEPVERKATQAEKNLEKEIAAMEKVLEKEIAEIKEILEEKLGKEKEKAEEIEVEIKEFAKKEPAPEEPKPARVSPRNMKLERQEALKYHYNLAIAYEEKEHYDEAEIEYKKALEAVPDDPDTHYNLGILYDDRFRDRVSAVKHYRKYLELKPGAQDKEQVKTWIRWAEQQIALGKF